MVVGDDGLYRNLQEYYRLWVYGYWNPQDFMHRSSIGQDTALSRREEEFDSPTVCQFFKESPLWTAIRVTRLWEYSQTVKTADF